MLLFRWRIAAKCKKLVRDVQCRLKFLKIKRRSIIKQLREDIVDLLRRGQPETAFPHAEELFKYQSSLAAYDLLEQFCESIILHLPHIRKHKNCPNDIKEAISTLVFAAEWCGDLPELQTIRKLFKERYGSKFIRELTEPNPGNHVNSQVKEKLCFKTITDDVKQSLIVELAQEHAMQPQHPGAARDKRLGSNVLTIGGKNNLHWQGFPSEGIAQGQGDYDVSCLAQMQLPAYSEVIQAKLPGQVVEVGNPVQTEHGYETKMVCNRISGSYSLGSFYSNHSSPTYLENKLETRRTSSRSSEEIEEIHISTLQNNYAGDITIFLFDSTRQSDRNNGFSGASRSCPRRIINTAPERVSKPTIDYGLLSDSSMQFQSSKGINSSSSRHVHPKLPDYDELVAKFKTLKEEHQKRKAASWKTIKN